MPEIKESVAEPIIAPRLPSKSYAAMAASENLRTLEFYTPKPGTS